MVIFKMELITIFFYFIFILLMGGIGLTMYLLVFKATPKAHLLKKVGNNFQLVKTIKFKLKDTELKFKTKSYMLDTKFAIIWKRSKPHLYFDIDNMKPLTFLQTKKYDPKMFQTLTDNKMLQNIFGKDQEKIMLVIILILVIALMVSVGFNFYVVSNPESFISIPSNSTTVVPISPIR